jgi:hypothetical protein
MAIDSLHHRGSGDVVAAIAQAGAESISLSPAEIRNATFMKQLLSKEVSLRVDAASFKGVFAARGPSRSYP